MPSPSAQADSQGVVDLVLCNDDLVGLILAHLPTPRLCLGNNPFYGTRGNRSLNDRLVAAGVSPAFRRAALRLPWEVALTENCPASVPATVALCSSRPVEALELELCHENVAQAAAALGCARGLRSLDLLTSPREGQEGCLGEWLQHPVTPLRPERTPAERISVQACLASLSRLTSLTADGFPLTWTGGSWVTALRRLKHLVLINYEGAPFGGLPCLESLFVRLFEGDNAFRLEHWASPRLTALRLECSDGGLLEAPAGSEPAHGLGVPATSDARAWLCGLQDLSLDSYHMEPTGAGLRVLTPHLTRLELYCWTVGWGHGPCLRHIFAKGLPTSLQALSVNSSLPAPPNLGSTVRRLTNLVFLEVQHRGAAPAEEAVQALVRRLSALPTLRRVDLTWRDVFEDQEGQRLKVGLEGLKTLLTSRGGSLHLSFSPVPAEYRRGAL